MKIVVIDGVEYVPKDTFISKTNLTRLSEAYCIAWGFGYYDPDHDCPILDHLRKVSDLLGQVNDELKFKE